MAINGGVPDNAINDKLTVINGELFPHYDGDSRF